MEKTLKDNRLFIKRVAGLILACIILVVSYLWPETESLSHAAILSLGVLLSSVALWFFETFPSGITGLFGTIMLVLLNVSGSIPEAFSGFTNPTVWFILAVFCLTAIMLKSTVGKRLTGRLVQWAGLNSKKLVLAFMIGTALISMVMTDTGAVVVSMSLALPLLKAINAEPGKSNIGKCIMIGIPFAAVLGGFATPVGHSLNILCIGILEAQTGIKIPFFNWMMVGVPICAIMLPICWYFITRAFKPETITQDNIDIITKSESQLGPWSALDKKSLAMLIILPAFWIIGSWVPALNSTTVIILGLIVMFIPGLDLLTWEDFQKNVGWNVVLMVGGIMSMGNAVQQTGAGDFIAQLFLNSGILSINLFLALLLITYAMYLIHTFCPIAPALCALFLPPLIVFAEVAGISPVLIVFIMASITAGNFLVPLNPTIIVSYAAGYYKFGEVAKGGWASAIIYVFLTVTWVYFVGQLIFPY